MRNKVVIGANFGDEGKGLMTDYFVSQFKGNCFVVRFNGGAQAGHTVVTPEGKWHKFSHFGAGSLQGAPTFLSKFFIVNPILFMREQKELGFSPRVCVDFECLVSTPYDMFINQALESTRGAKKHGSCGMGIHETVVRSEQAEFCIKAIDFLNPDRWERKLKRVAEDYYPKRMEELGLSPVIFDYDKFVDIFDDFDHHIELGDSETLKESKLPLVFEGAQGLLLDQNHSNFPYVTHSNTGFQNVKDILREIGISRKEVEVTYVTRAYVTRHGRGPFPTEMVTLPFNKVEDDTNVYNEFQEQLRFGLSDLTSLKEEIKKDQLKNGLDNISVAVTCLDQAGEGNIHYHKEGAIISNSNETFLRDVQESTECSTLYTSFGKTRNTVTKRS